MRSPSIARLGFFSVLLILGGLAVWLVAAACVTPAATDRVVQARPTEVTVTLATTGRNVAATAEPRARAKLGCDDWPFSESDRRALAAQAIAFLEQLYATRRPGANAKWTLDAADQTVSWH